MDLKRLEILLKYDKQETLLIKEIESGNYENIIIERKIKVNNCDSIPYNGIELPSCKDFIQSDIDMILKKLNKENLKTKELLVEIYDQIEEARKTINEAEKLKKNA